MTEKRFNYHMGLICENKNGEHILLDIKEVCDMLNELSEENEQLKQSVNNLKDTIIKITIAYQRKYDRTIVNLVHEVHDEDITDLIKELEDD